MAPITLQQRQLKGTTAVFPQQHLSIETNLIFTVHDYCNSIATMFSAMLKYLHPRMFKKSHRHFLLATGAGWNLPQDPVGPDATTTARTMNETIMITYFTLLRGEVSTKYWSYF